MSRPISIDPAATLAHIASTHANAARVFQTHGLDFCCHGQESLAAACQRKGLDLAELERQMAQGPGAAPENWDQRALPELIEHLLERFHEVHRAELPQLIEMATKVEEVHAGKPDCPRGLAAMLQRVQDELEDHLQKEEQVLFPLIRAGRGRMAGMPIAMMETEHREHASNLERLRALAHGYTPPAQACNTWKALYAGLCKFELDLMQHIHLENHVLFPRALRS